jgi:hypothetical protein
MLFLNLPLVDIHGLGMDGMGGSKRDGKAFDGVLGVEILCLGRLLALEGVCADIFPVCSIGITW